MFTMKMYKFVLLVIFLPFVCVGSDSKKYTNIIPSVGISTTAASITVCSLVKYAIPNKAAQAIAPWTYGAGKNLLLLGAVTSALSSAFIVKDLVQTVNRDVDTQYIDIAGAALPVGYIFSFVGDYLVYKADRSAHDDRLTKRVRIEEAALREPLVPKSWGNKAKKSKTEAAPSQHQPLLASSHLVDIENR